MAGQDNEKWADDLNVVVQAGGESKRMGRSKALVPFLGEPLIMRSVRRLLPICREMIVTTNEPERMNFLRELADSGRLRIATDGTSTRGALVGMRTAMASASCGYVALAACDMIFASPKLMLALRDRLEQTGADVCVPKTRFGFEPFHAVYRRETCLRAIEARLACGELRAISWFDDVRVETVGMDFVSAICPAGGVFMNVNTPDGLRDAQQWLIEAGKTDPLDVPPPPRKALR